MNPLRRLIMAGVCWSVFSPAPYSSAGAVECAAEVRAILRAAPSSEARIHELRGLANSKPGCLMAHFQLALALEHEERWAEAAVAFEACLALESGTDLARKIERELDSIRRRLRLAADVGARLTPSYASLLASAEAHRRLGRLPEASTDADAAMAIAPMRLEAYLLAAQIAADQRHYDLAASHLEEAETLARRHALEGALKLITAARERLTSLMQKVLEANRLLAEQKHLPAADLLAESWRLHPSDLKFALGAAQAFVMGGKPAAGAAVLDEVIQESSRRGDPVPPELMAARRLFGSASSAAATTSSLEKPAVSKTIGKPKSKAGLKPAGSMASEFMRK